jgi:hypothetical protein
MKDVASGDKVLVDNGLIKLVAMIDSIQLRVVK